MVGEEHGDGGTQGDAGKEAEETGGWGDWRSGEHTQTSGEESLWEEARELQQLPFLVWTSTGMECTESAGEGDLDW